ncbi:hypothetical protein [Zoogloea sp.]|uniref:hypothetical protein n=1 Tax=Zoogloea sp. TaxID=49181 RepID=UPI00261A37E0|nr:hypothetical protein [Zoogloea sp.]MDD3354782.1 hypothetical protein [Zoogloea sp.]
MALPWSTLVKAIPWSDVIAKAPDIAQGARKLWQKAAQRTDTTHPEDMPAPETASGLADMRLAELEGRLAQLNARQQETAELLAALAAQNAELVRLGDNMRARLGRLTFACAFLTAGLLGLGLLLILRP